MYNRQIQTFIQVADCGSFSKAAEKLLVTTASVMKQMNALEERVGVQLMERTNHGVVLTAAGRSIYKDARHIIQESEEAVARAREAAGAQQYIIRVGTSLLNPCKALIDLWGQISDQNPGFQIKIVPFEDDHTGILETIASLGKNIDFVVGACGSREWGRRCNVHRLGQYQICCAIPRKHRLAGKPLLQFSDLYGERLMMVKRGDSEHIDRLRDLLEREHPQVQIVDTPYFYDAGVFNECEQRGCILLTLDAWADVHPALVTVPVAWDFTTPYGLLYASKPSRDVLAFLDALKAAGKEDFIDSASRE